MIKEKLKISIYNQRKPKHKVLFEYVRTVAYSLVAALFVTIILAIYAHNDMVKNFTLSPEEQLAINRNIARQIISHSDLLEGLANSTCLVCLQVGYLYETVGEYENAQTAFELAVKKSPPNYYRPFYHLIYVLAAQEKFDEANKVLSEVKDLNNRDLVKFKSRAHIIIGDKFYSLGKFLSAAKSYEKAEFYYNKFAKKNKRIVVLIKERIINSYINVADIMVAAGKNSEAIRYLEKAKQHDKDNFLVRYKLAVILSDFDPEKAVETLESLLKERPQDIDYAVYNKALVNAAMLADYNGNLIKGKYYRYKIYSTDMYLDRKVIYKNDIKVTLKSFLLRKYFFATTLQAYYGFLNASSNEVNAMNADFVLTRKDKPVETITITIASKENVLDIGSEEPRYVRVNFSQKFFNRKELDNYAVKVYLYKNPKYKTFVFENKIPKKSFK